MAPRPGRRIAVFVAFIMKVKCDDACVKRHRMAERFQADGGPGLFARAVSAPVAKAKPSPAPVQGSRRTAQPRRCGGESAADTSGPPRLPPPPMAPAPARDACGQAASPAPSTIRAASAMRSRLNRWVMRQPVSGTVDPGDTCAAIPPRQAARPIGETGISFRGTHVYGDQIV